MQLVVRDKPSNPHQFLANYILQYQQQMEKQQDLLRKNESKGQKQRARNQEGQSKEADRSGQQRHKNAGNSGSTLPRIQSTPVLQNHNTCSSGKSPHRNQSRTISDQVSLPPVAGKTGEPWNLHKSVSAQEKAEIRETLEEWVNSNTSPHARSFREYKDQRLVELQARIKNAESNFHSITSLPFLPASPVKQASTADRPCPAELQARIKAAENSFHSVTSLPSLQPPPPGG